MRRLPILVTAAPLVLLLHAQSVRAGWTPGVGTALCTEDSNQTYIAACTDGAGGAFVVWTDFRDSQLDPYLVGGSDIFAQRVNAAGVPQWTANGRGVCTHAYGQLETSTVSDGAGGAIIAWFDYRNGNADIYAQRIDTNGQPLWNSDGIAVATGPGDQYRPIVVTDGAGGAIVVYHLSGGANPIAYAQRINSAGVIQWAPGGVLVGAGLPTVIADGVGGAWIAIDRYILYAWDDIFLQRLNAQGVPQWNPPTGVPVCTNFDEQGGPLLALDGADGVFVTWSDFRNSLRSVYAQRVNGLGQVQWAANGISLCSTGSPHGIVADGNGAAIVAWLDTRIAANNYNIYAQRIDATGATQWTTNGISLCGAGSVEYIANSVTDGSGGAIVTWVDHRGQDRDIYAQRIDGFGTVKWAQDGVGLVTIAGDQGTGAAIPDGDHGAIVPYQSGAYGSVDVYAQKVNTDGVVPSGVVGSTPSARLVVGNARPNPFSSEVSIDVTLQQESAVSVDVFDVAGRKVRSMDVGRLHAGPSRLTFDGRNDRGAFLPSGVYFCRVCAGSQTVTRKMVIAR